MIYVINENCNGIDKNKKNEKMIIYHEARYDEISWYDK